MSFTMQFIHQKPVHILNSPLYFHTSTNGDANSMLDFLINLFATFLLIPLSTSTDQQGKDSIIIDAPKIPSAGRLCNERSNVLDLGYTNIPSR